MRIRFLGVHSAESKNTRLASFLIDGVLAVEAGSLVSELSFQEQEKVKAILLSHGHYDHIRDVPAFAFNNCSHVTKVLATAQTLQIVSSHLLDGVIYPEFTGSNSFLGKPVLELCVIEPFKPEVIEGYHVLALPVNHTIDAVGFEISSGGGKSLFYTGDTGPPLSSIWEQISPQLIIADVTFPDRLENTAVDSGHLSPRMLKQELTEFRRINGYLPKVILTHLSPQYESDISEEIKEIGRELQLAISIVSEGDELVF